MKQAIVPFIICLTLLQACSSETSASNDIMGSWSLTYFECCLLLPEVYEEGEIIWSFESDSSLYIQINIVLDSESQLPVKESSTLTYSSGQNMVTIGNTSYRYSIEKDQLILADRPESDGPRIIFSKN